MSTAIRVVCHTCGERNYTPGVLTLLHETDDDIVVVGWRCAICRRVRSMRFHNRPDLVSELAATGRLISFSLSGAHAPMRSADIDAECQEFSSVIYTCGDLFAAITGNER